MNPWKILGVNRQSTEEEVRTAYLSLAKKYHPDKKGGNKDKFVAANNAFALIANRQRRSDYLRDITARYPKCTTCRGEGVVFKRKGLTQGAASSCIGCGGAGVMI